MVTRTVYLSLPANNDATGEPAITGTAQVGQDLTADESPIMDTDGLPSSFTYKWFRVDSDGTSNEAEISGETDATYTLTDDDEGKKVKVKVSFTDDLNGEEERTSAAYPSSGTVTAAAGTNTAPVFSSSSVSRSIAENTAAGQNVGAAVTATDADAGDTLVYTLGGADAASFDFVESSGQIRTKTNVAYDFEAKSSYTVTVTASDGTDTAVATVTIGITDVDEPPSAPATPAVSAVSGSTTSLSVSWAAPANAGKPAIANYDVQYRAGSSGTWSDGPQDVATTSTTIASLVANTAYQARVRATNAEGDSGWSDPPGSGRTNSLTNTAPTAADETVTTAQDTNYTFTTADFGFVDADDEPLVSVLIVTVPAAGRLALNGVAVMASRTVTRGEIVDGGLKFEPAVGESGAPYTTFTFKVNDGTDDSVSAYTMTIDVMIVSGPDAPTGTVTLVSNANQGLDTSSTTRTKRAQAFTTGAAAATLSSVEIISEDSQGDDAAVSLCTVNVDNLPTSSCTALTAPSSFAAGTLVFTAPANTTLAANTTYSLLVTSPGSQFLVLDVTRSGAEDAGGTTGWSIANNFHHFPGGAANWTNHTMRALRITIKDASANNAPTVATAIPDRTATAGAAFSYAFPAHTFADTDTGDTLTYTATKSDDSELPSWLGFAAATRTFSGTPQAADVGTVSVKVTASDGTDSVSDTFDIVVNVAGTNNAPMVANAIPNQTATVGTVFNYAFPANTFNDADAGDTLVYTATKSNNSALPSWLSFAPATRTFSGTAADAGTVSVKVTASDSTDSVSDTFDIVVSANTAPTAADKTVTTAQDTNYTFTPFNFGYVDADDDSLASVLIVTVPAEGALALNGVAVMASRTVTRAEISDGHLKFEPATGESGAPYTTFTFKVNDGTDDSVSAYTMTIDVMIVSAPDAPTGLTATASGQAWIELAWTAPVHAGGSAITGYTIEVSPDGSTWSDLVAATASTATTYVHKGLSAGATRHYRVSAINSAMNVVRTSDSSGSDHATTRTDEQLVSNFNYLGDADNIHLTIQNVVGIFTTGSREAKLNSIELKLGKSVNRTVAPALKLYTLNLDNNGRATLGTEVATLDTPSTSLTVNSFRTFSYQAPSGTSLTASQAYMFVLEPPSRGIVLVETTTDPSEDDVKADGWTIDGSGSGTSPFYIGPRKQIVFRVNGTTTNNAATGAPAITGTAQAGQELTADASPIMDTDGLPSSFTYKWFRVDSDGTSNEAEISGETDATYTLTDDDVGKKVKVKVSFTDDLNGEEERTSAAYPSSGTVTAAAGTNTAPVFSSSSVSRSIAENTAAGQNVGAAVTATDADAGDTLGYTLGGADAASFDFVESSGQIRTKTNVAYDFEAKSSYTVTVTASDGTDTAVATVTIGITDVDEPPSAPATPAVSAVSGSTTSLSVSWAAPANAGKPAIANYDVQYRAGSSGTWSDGPQDVATTSTTIASLVANTAYQARVRATNAEGDSGWSDPPGSGRTNSLTNTAATGEPAITGTAQAGQELTADASPIMDTDGLPSSFTYKWFRVDSDGTSNEAEISGETDATYTLTDDDVGKKVKVKVSFTDDLNGEEERTSAAYPSSGTVTAAAGTNTAPSSERVPQHRGEHRRGPERRRRGDGHDADAGDTLGYTLGGADAASFDFVESSGQIRTKTNVAYDFEAKSSYTVTVTASDGTDTAVATVTIGITAWTSPPARRRRPRSRQSPGAPPACRSPGPPRPTPASPPSPTTTCSTERAAPGPGATPAGCRDHVHDHCQPRREHRLPVRPTRKATPAGPTRPAPAGPIR